MHAARTTLDAVAALDFGGSQEVFGKPFEFH